jgi:hypothetical protein
MFGKKKPCHIIEMGASKGTKGNQGIRYVPRLQAVQHDNQMHV